MKSSHRVPCSFLAYPTHRQEQALIDRFEHVGSWFATIWIDKPPKRPNLEPCAIPCETGLRTGFPRSYNAEGLCNAPE
jgi:hypothetical protein